MKQKIMALTAAKHELLTRLVGPARAAANQMKDAGMKAGADPLLEILFQIDANDQEVQALFESNPKAAILVMFELMGGGAR